MTAKTMIQRALRSSTGICRRAMTIGAKSRAAGAGAQEHHDPGIELANGHSNQQIRDAPDHGHRQKEGPATSRHGDHSSGGRNNLRFYVSMCIKWHYAGWSHWRHRVRRVRGPSSLRVPPRPRNRAGDGRDSNAGKRIGEHVPGVWPRPIRPWCSPRRTRLRRATSTSSSSRCPTVRARRPRPATGRARTSAVVDLGADFRLKGREDYRRGTARSTARRRCSRRRSTDSWSVIDKELVGANADRRAGLLSDGERARARAISRRRVVERRGIIVNALSGTSGAGRATVNGCTSRDWPATPRPTDCSRIATRPRSNKNSTPKCSSRRTSWRPVGACW